MWKKLIRASIFTFILCILVMYLQNYFGNPGRRDYNHLRGLFLENKNSLDAVYIGSSNVHAFWTPPIAWMNHGIAIWSFSNDAQPTNPRKYFLIEAHKYQPSALFIMNINSFIQTNVTVKSLHFSADYLPFSLNKMNMIYHLAKEEGSSILGKLEFFLPIIRFHSRWSNLGSWVFRKPDNSLKVGLNANEFLNRIQDISAQYIIEEKYGELTQKEKASVDDLLDCCDALHVRVLFVTVPHARPRIACTKFNTIEDIIKKRGYPVLNLIKNIDKVGIQPTTDYYNGGHTNIHGSLKFTEYLSRYLIEHYGFKDKRGLPGWESWDKSIELYGRVINPWTLPLERECAPRDYSLSAPSLNRPAVKEQDVTVSWKAVKGAEGYEIYRKSNAEQRGYWHHIKTVGADVLSHSDHKLKAKTQYTYTVVPFRKKNDKTLYGHFSFNGVTATTGGK